MSAIDVPTHWKGLSFREKQHGTHPANLINFEFIDSPLDELALQWFFTGSRMSCTEFEFRLNGHQLQANPTFTYRIRAIFDRVVAAPSPEEKPLETGLLAYFGLPLEEHQKLCIIYSKMLLEKKCFLMHPARKTELIAYFGGIFSDPDLVASRLITLRCFGSLALKIAHLTARLSEANTKKRALEGEFHALLLAGTTFISDAKKLSESDFPCIKDPICRKYVVLAYKDLASKGKLEILRLYPDELYNPAAAKPNHIHASLASLETAYYENAPAPTQSFEKVILYLRELRHAELNGIEQYFRNLELQAISRLTSEISAELFEASKTSMDLSALIQRNPDHFDLGDFTFLPDRNEAACLARAFRLTSKLDIWAFFNQNLMGKTHEWLLHQPDLINLKYELDEENMDRFTYILSWLEKIQKLGWRCTVQDFFNDMRKPFGVLNGGWKV